MGRIVVGKMLVATTKCLASFLRDWGTRWKEAGGEFFEGRMIALKTDEVWIKLSRFKRPHPPFDFNSGMGVEEVDRDTAEGFGLVKPGQKLKPDFNAAQAHPKASLAGTPQKWRDGLKRIFGAQIEIAGDEARWRPRTAIKQGEKEKAASLAGKASQENSSVPLPKIGRGVLIDPRLLAPEEKELLNLKAFERAIGYDAQGRRIPGHVDGGADSIEEVPARLRPPGGTLTHNHPHGGSFSGYDINFMAWNETRELRAVGNQGRGRRYLYRMSFSESLSSQGRLEAASRYDAIWKETIKDSKERIRRGEITGAHADRELEHWVMETLAKELQGGLFYERILLR